MSEIPRMKKRFKVEDSEEKSGREGLKELDAKVSQQAGAPDPLLARLIFIDWSSLSVMENPEAVEAITQLIKNCHAEVLRWILNLVKDRIYNDARLWTMKGDTIDLLQLGEEIYVRRRH